MDLTARGRDARGRHHRSRRDHQLPDHAPRARPKKKPQPSIEPTARLIYERFGSLVLGEGSDDVPEALVAELAAHQCDPGHGRVVHRRPDRPHDHGDRRASALTTWAAS